MEKILSIVWYKVLPALFGGQKGIAGFNESLAKDHPLVCLCSSDNIPADNLLYRVLPRLSIGKKQFLLRSSYHIIKKAAQEENPSHIIAEHPYYGRQAIRVCKAIGAKLIVHSHNIESERFRQLGKLGWQILRLYEGWVHRQADLGLFKTSADLEFAISKFRLDREKCMIVPYCIEQPANESGARALIEKKYSIAPGEKILFFAGTLDYPPNQEAVNNIVNQLVSILLKHGLKFRIIICGRDKTYSTPRSPQSGEHIIFAGEVPNIQIYFAAADVFINPVMKGGGIQTKNIDALAHGCELVCFEHMTDPTMAELAPEKIHTAAKADWEGFSSQVAVASKRKTATPRSFFEYYNWDKQLAKLNEWIRTN